MPAPNPLLSRPLSPADASTLRTFERGLRSESPPSRSSPRIDSTAASPIQIYAWWMFLR